MLCFSKEIEDYAEMSSTGLNQNLSLKLPTSLINKEINTSRNVCHPKIGAKLCGKNKFLEMKSPYSPAVKSGSRFSGLNTDLQCLFEPCGAYCWYPGRALGPLVFYCVLDLPELWRWLGYPKLFQMAQGHFVFSPTNQSWHNCLCKSTGFWKTNFKSDESQFICTEHKYPLEQIRRILKEGLRKKISTEYWYKTKMSSFCHCVSIEGFFF